MLPVQGTVQMVVLAGVHMGLALLVYLIDEPGSPRSRGYVWSVLSNHHIHCQPWLHCVPELVQKGVVCQEIDVLDMVVRLLSSLSLASGLPRVYALQDTEPPAAN